MSKDTELLDCLRSFGKLILMVVIFCLAPAQSISPRTATMFVYVVLYFHFLYISHINQLHLHDIHLLPVMYISCIIYIILNSRCYTGVGAPKFVAQKFLHKRALWEGLGRASRGLDGGLRRA